MVVGPITVEREERREESKVVRRDANRKQKRVDKEQVEAVFGVEHQHKPTNNAHTPRPHYAYRDNDLAIEDHAKYESAVMEKERKKRAHDFERRSNRIVLTKEAFRQRRQHNHALETKTGFVIAQPPAPTGVYPKRPRNSPIKKNWCFYRRQGFVWTDLYHTPECRMKVVVPRAFLEKDVECLSKLISRMEMEEELAAQERNLKLERTAATREHFRERRRAARANTALQIRGDRSVEQLRPAAVTERLERLATPKPGVDRLKSYVSKSHADTNGLLCTDRALADLLPWHEVATEVACTRAELRKYLNHLHTVDAQSSKVGSKIESPRRPLRSRPAKEKFSVEYPPDDCTFSSSEDDEEGGGWSITLG